MIKNRPAGIAANQNANCVPPSPLADAQPYMRSPMRTVIAICARRHPPSFIAGPIQLAFHLLNRGIDYNTSFEGSIDQAANGLGTRRLVWLP